MTPAPPVFPGALLMGTETRLLPYDVPLRFFAAAAAFHALAWGLLGAAHADVPGFAGGPGLALAALHAVTLGVLAMTAMGAAYQVLGVATGVVLKSLLPCRLSFWLFAPGTAVLVAGMALIDAT
ncbi:MAG: hypothetical protein HQL35_15860, partial [Alphaproteobacteria bacterium]|nr:hypothetical protein [Alphaproteobacteria bacterium]